MEHRRLGRTELDVSEIGFGAWGLGGTMWRGVSDETARESLAHALDLGVDFIDTALVYGDGHSERAIADVLASRGGRGRVVVATKIPPRNYVWPGKASTALRDVFPAAYVTASVEMSLKNLGTDCLDVEQFHVWHDAWLEDPEWDKTRSALERLRREGKVRHWGVSINDHAPETALKLLADPIIETAQVIYNIFDRSPEREFFDLVRERAVAVIVRVPFDEGALTGDIGPETVFPLDDWRNRYFRGDRKDQAARRAEALRELLGEEASTLPELALRFCLSRSEVSTVIPGMRTARHARENTAVSDGRRLSAELLGRLEAHAWNKDWYRD